MRSLTFEDVFPIAQNLARKKAKGVIRRCGLPLADRDDIESELLLAFYAAFPKLDGHRASVRTFASRVMDKRLLSILRHRLARCREHLLETAPLDELKRTATCNGPTTLERKQFWLDIERALASSPDKLRETVVGLCWETPLELSRSSGRSRAAIYYRIEHLRQALTSAGIDHTYFRS